MGRQGQNLKDVSKHRRKWVVVMAFNNLGSYHLANGAKVTIAVQFDNYADKGALYFMASPDLDAGFFPQSGLAVLTVDNFTKCSWHDFGTGLNYYTYNVDVTNRGTVNGLTQFGLDGGGLI